jgi:CheY-like chemotaxis protein
VVRIMFSSHGRTDTVSLEAAGIAISHVKPVRPSQLLDDIASLFGMPQETPAPTTSAAPAPSIDGSGVALSVLLVEDNIVNQKVALGALRRLGVTASLATDGEQAVARLATERFDLVLMDCQMPVMDGFTATAAIREREAREARPRQVIVAMTANAMEGDRELCLAAGMDDYLTKPFNLGALLAVMKKWLRGFTVPEEIAQKRKV